MRISSFPSSVHKYNCFPDYMEFGIISTPFLHIFGFQGVGTFILDPNFYDHSVSFSDMAAVPARML